MLNKCCSKYSFFGPTCIYWTYAICNRRVKFVGGGMNHTIWEAKYKPESHCTLLNHCSKIKARFHSFFFSDIQFHILNPKALTGKSNKMWELFKVFWATQRAIWSHQNQIRPLANRGQWLENAPGGISMGLWDFANILYSLSGFLTK